MSDRAWAALWGVLWLAACDGAPACDPGMAACGGTCVNLASDRLNCGACGNACGADRLCESSACVVSCSSGMTACAGACVSTSSSPAHCGGCNMPCASNEVCESGACELGCSATMTECGGSCVDTNTDEAHCGGCDMPCDAAEVCTDGACECDAGLTECGGACVDTDSSASHCGGCDMPCASPSVCSDGSCEASCATDLTDCGGACVDTATSMAHCGGCDMACTGADRACVAGGCACAGGLTECGGACVDTDNDASFCGDCATACATGQLCGAGVCRTPTWAGALVGAEADGTNNGLWSFGGTLGIAGADVACNAAFPGSAHCTREQLEAIGSAGGLTGAMDADGNDVASLWIDDSTLTDDQRCGAAGAVPWSCGSGSCDGRSAFVSGGMLDAVGVAACGSTHHVGCCLP